ncbi:phage tail tape measure protein [Streptomyces sp. NPDC060286]|uniref:phage tail tape measure protein n=1 Tax=unclassified Streptomyces TaxID=2593676 RepID=UPI0035E18AD0
MGRPSTLAIRVTSDSRQARQDVAGAERGISGSLGKLKSAGPALAAAAGAAIGAALVSAVGEALNQGKIVGKLGAQLGATPAEAARYGKVAGQLYSKGITEDFQSAADSISATMRSGLAPPGATNAQLESIATKASDLATVFDQDVYGATRAAAQMIKTGLVKDSNEAFDVLTRGFQSGANSADDLLDTFNEYGTQFRDLGLNGKTAMGLLSQGLKGGARDADLVADALKELNIRVKDKSAADALKTLGLDADAMATKFAKGGPEAAAALDQILDRLRNVKDPAERSALAVELLGTQAEDMAQALFSLDPSTAVDALGKVKGASDGLGKSMRDNAGAEITAFQRTAKQKLVEFIGAKVIPVLRDMYGFFNDNIAPVIRLVGQLYAAYLMPILNALREGIGKVTKAVKDHQDKWEPLLYFLREHFMPMVGKLVGKLVGGLFSALAKVVDGIGKAIDWGAKFVAWIKDAIKWIGKLKPPGWLSKLGGFIGLSADAPSTRTATQYAALSAPGRAAAPSPLQMIARGAAAPVVVNVTIDGQQLQGRINRTVSSALQYEGARYLAGGWA